MGDERCGETRAGENHDGVRGAPCDPGPLRASHRAQAGALRGRPWSVSGAQPLLSRVSVWSVFQFKRVDASGRRAHGETHVAAALGGRVDSPRRGDGQGTRRARRGCADEAGDRIFCAGDFRQCGVPQYESHFVEFEIETVSGGTRQRQWAAREVCRVSQLPREHQRINGWVCRLVLFGSSTDAAHDAEFSQRAETGGRVGFSTRLHGVFRRVTQRLAAGQRRKGRRRGVQSAHHAAGSVGDFDDDAGRDGAAERKSRAPVGRGEGRVGRAAAGHGDRLPRQRRKSTQRFSRPRGRNARGGRGEKHPEERFQTKPRARYSRDGGSADGQRSAGLVAQPLESIARLRERVRDRRCEYGVDGDTKSVAHLYGAGGAGGALRRR